LSNIDQRGRCQSSISHEALKTVTLYKEANWISGTVPSSVKRKKCHDKCLASTTKYSGCMMQYDTNELQCLLVVNDKLNWNVDTTKQSICYVKINQLLFHKVDSKGAVHTVTVNDRDNGNTVCHFFHCPTSMFVDNMIPPKVTEYKGTVLTNWGTSYLVNKYTSWMITPGSGTIMESTNGGWDYARTSKVMVKYMFQTLNMSSNSVASSSNYVPKLYGVDVSKSDLEWSGVDISYEENKDDSKCEWNPFDENKKITCSAALRGIFDHPCFMNVLFT
jgi:hypothetical protein